MKAERYHGKCAQTLGKAILLFESLISRNLQYREKETSRDTVTNIDLALHSMICRDLAESNIPVFSEEGLPREKTQELYWIIDPIDGTTNMISGIPFFGISLGLVESKVFAVGAFGMPATKEIFYTAGPASAYRNEARMRVVEKELRKCLIGVCFSSKGGLGSVSRKEEFQVFQELNDSSRGCLRLGSAGCTICYVASGKLGAAFGVSVKSWDVAASLAIAKAAGCDVRVADGDVPENLHFIAGKGQMMDQIQERLTRAVPMAQWRGM